MQREKCYWIIIESLAVFLACFFCYYTYFFDCLSKNIEHAKDPSQSYELEIVYTDSYVIFGSLKKLQFAILEMIQENSANCLEQITFISNIS